MSQAETIGRGGAFDSCSRTPIQGGPGSSRRGNVCVIDDGVLVVGRQCAEGWIWMRDAVLGAWSGRWGMNGSEGAGDGEGFE